MGRVVDYPKQDRDAGLPPTTLGDREVTKYDPSMALQIIEQVAEGGLLKDICAPGTGMVARSTFMKWVARVPELKQAYLAARTLSAASFEEEAIDYARKVKRSPGTTQQVRATEVAISQLRWSAAKRDAQNFGDRAGGVVVVPVNIQTTLDMGEGALTGVEMPDIYTIEVKPPAEIVEAKALIEDLTVDKLGSERTALGHRPNRGGKNLPKPTKEKVEKLVAEGKISPFSKLAEKFGVGNG